MRWTPERSEYPARTFGIFPRRHAAPDTRGREVDLLIANQRSAINRCLMILAARGFRVEQVDSAFLAPGNHQFSSFVIKDGGSDLHIEIFLDQPCPIRRDVPVPELQLRSFDTRADQAIAVLSCGGIVSA